MIQTGRLPLRTAGEPVAVRVLSQDCPGSASAAVVASGTGGSRLAFAVDAPYREVYVSIESQATGWLPEGGAGPESETCARRPPGMGAHNAMRPRAFRMLIPLVLAALSAPQANAAPAKPVRLHLWNIPAKGSTSPVNVARRRVFDAFCRRNPAITVRALVPLRIEGPQREGNEFLAVAGGVAPDVFYLYGRKVGDYRTQGFLLPLDDYLADYSRRHGQPYTGINSPDKVWELCHDRGRIVCVPHLYYSMALMCNRELFARAGYGERAPANWQELYEFARRLTRDPAKEPGADPNEPMQFGLSILTGIGAGWHYLQYVWSSGGEVVQSYYPIPGRESVSVPPPLVDYKDFHIQLSNQAAYDRQRAGLLEDLVSRGIPTDYSVDDLQWRLLTNTAAAMPALALFRKLVHQPWLRNGDHEFDITPAMLRARRAVDPITGDVFDLADERVRERVYHGVADAVSRQSGQKIERVRYGMQIGTLGEANTVDPATLFAVPFPSRQGVAPASFIAGHYLGVNAAIVATGEPGREDVEAIRRTAWKYIEFVTGPEAQKIRVETLVEHGLEEFIRPALLEDAGYADLLDRIPPARRKLWENLSRSARVEPYCDGFTHVMTKELSHPIEVLINDPPDPTTGEYKTELQVLMDDTVRHVNTMILGKMPDDEVARRSRIGWVIFAVMAAALVTAGAVIIKLALRAQAKWRDLEGFGVGGNAARRTVYGWLLLAPALATILIWAYFPLVRGMAMAFQDYKILGGSVFVGLRNFVEITSAPEFWRYLLQTVQYMVMMVGIGFCVPIILALLLTEIPRGKVIFRVIYYLPAVTTGLVTLFLWKGLLYDPTANGVLNRIILAFNALPPWVAAITKMALFGGLTASAAGLSGQALTTANSTRARIVEGVLALATWCLIGYFVVSRLRGGGMEALAGAFSGGFDFRAQRFLRDPQLAMLWCVVPTIWATAGPGCLIYLAALKGIPEAQYEAADIDGAGVWQKFWNVTFPNLNALVIINFVGAVVAGFKASSNIFVMTGGGPENATMTIGLEIWYNAFLYLKFGTATAMGWIMGALLIGFTLNQLRILNKLEFRSVAVEEEAAGARA